MARCCALKANFVPIVSYGCSATLIETDPYIYRVSPHLSMMTDSVTLSTSLRELPSVMPSLPSSDSQLAHRSKTYAISLIALVNSGRTHGSESMGKHAMGPCLLYVWRNLWSGAPISSSSCVSAILITTSGLSSPCAVRNVGRVSLAARTELLMAGRLVLDPDAVRGSLPGLIGEEGLRRVWRWFAAEMEGGVGKR